MKLGSKTAWAKTLGSGCAHVQHGVDKAAEWGFAKLKDIEGKGKGRGKENIGRSVLGFFGQMGENYYKKYEELKKK